MELNQRLKELRLEHQLTQEELAQKIFVSRQTISNWENGKGQPDLENLILLSEYYQVSLTELVEGPLPSQDQPKFFVARRFLISYLVLCLIALICQIVFQPKSALVPLLFAIVCAIQSCRYLFKTKCGANLYGQGENMYDIGIIMAGLFYMMILVAIALQGIVTGEIPLRPW